MAGRSQVIQVALLAVALTLTACRAVGSGTAAPSPSQSASPSRSAATLPSVSAAPSAAPFPTIVLPPESHARLGSTLDLFLRTFPPNASETVWQPSGTLPAGQMVVVAAGPRDIHGDVGTWYEIQWLAAGQQKDAWVRAADAGSLVAEAPDCSLAPDAALAMLAGDRLACFGSKAVTVTGTIGHCQGGVVLAQPGWLAYACWAVSDGTNGMDIHATPDSGIVFPDATMRARLTGHFDDRAAATCRSSEQVWQAPSPDEQVFLCREAFVVDTLKVL